MTAMENQHDNEKTAALQGRDAYEKVSSSVETGVLSNSSVDALDPRNPRSWPTGRRVAISLFATMAFFTISVANSIYIGSFSGVLAEFHLSQTLAIAPITLYSIGFVLGPALATAFSEHFGRQYIYKVALVLSLAFTVVAGSATHFRTLAIGRTLAGITASPCAAVFVGLLNDLWDVSDKMAPPMIVLYALSPVFAIEVGPAMGAAIVDDRGWRWSFWLAAILLGVCTLCLLPTPETFMPAIIRKQEKGDKGGKNEVGRESEHLEHKPVQTLAHTFKIAIGRPMHMLLVEPIIWPSAALVTAGQCVLFIFYVGYPLILSSQYGFSEYNIGLSFLPLLVGSVLAVPVIGYCNKTKYEVARAKAESLGEIVAPEERLYPAMIGSVMLPVALFWLAWTARSDIHWIVPLLSGIPYGCGLALTQLPLPWYKNDVYGTKYGASAFAADLIMRYTVSSVCPLFAAQMIDAMTFKWAMSMLGFICLVLMPVPWFLYKCGPRLRANSRYVGVKT